MQAILLSPPVALILFLGLAYGLYRLGGRVAAAGEESTERRKPYTGGEDVPPPERRLSYHAFFRLALMFSVLHLATLTVSTLPGTNSFQPIGLIYLVGIAISVLVLVQEGEL